MNSRRTALRRRPGATRKECMRIVAHRGASGERPEHTLGAYELAIERGADGLECDVRLTRDGHLVCFHDRTMERVSVEKLGRGQGIVSTMTLDDMRQLNIGTPEEPARVMTLAELLELYQDTRRENIDGLGGCPQRELFIETKHPNRYGSRVEHQLAETLRRYRLGDDAAVNLISFSPQSLVRFKLINPRIRRILLRREYQRMIHPGMEAMNVVDAHGLSIAKARLRPDIVGRRGLATYVWTADKEDEVRWAARHGVNWLATNYPGRAKMWRDEEQAAGRGEAGSAGRGIGAA